MTKKERQVLAIEEALLKEKEKKAKARAKEKAKQRKKNAQLKELSQISEEEKPDVPETPQRHVRGAKGLEFIAGKNSYSKLSIVEHSVQAPAGWVEQSDM